MSELEIMYDGAYNVVVECTECGTERGSSVVAGTKLRPGRTFYEPCDTCGGWRYHEPLRQAERGEYDGHLICDDCDQEFGNTMDVDLHDCPSENDDDSDDEPEVVTDGGEDFTDHVTDQTIQHAIAQNDDREHSNAHTVAEIRELLGAIQEGAEYAWATYMDHVEDGDAEVVSEDSDTIVLDTGEHNSVADDLEYGYDGVVEITPIAKTIVTQVHHELARERCEHNWGTTYPFVIAKPDEFDAGQRYTEAVMNGLQQRGLSPGQAWAYYGVEIRGNSRNNWGLRKGDHDHKNVSDALQKANQKLPGV
jgi:hypothetical protein